jgi:hypothetical protein
MGPLDTFQCRNDEIGWFEEFEMNNHRIFKTLKARSKVDVMKALLFEKLLRYSNPNKPTMTLGSTFLYTDCISLW